MLVPTLLTLIIAMATRTTPPARELAGSRDAAYARDLQRVVDRAVGKTLAAFAGSNLDSSEIAVTLVDLSTPKLRWASYRGDVPVYPASVVKLFFLVATHARLEEGTLKDTDELRRAMHDMIVDSSNDATHYVVDVLTGTTSGPELSEGELAAWYEQRNTVNRYFTAQGYEGINANKKPWCEGPYGREIQASRAYEPRRNQLTTDATARLLTDIARGRAVTGERSEQMMELLKRDPFSPSSDPDDQSTGYTGPALTPGMRLWSKAGWTGEVRHDAAVIEWEKRRIVLVTFTVGHADDRAIIPSVAREVIAAMGTK